MDLNAQCIEVACLWPLYGGGSSWVGRVTSLPFAVNDKGVVIISQRVIPSPISRVI